MLAAFASSAFYNRYVVLPCAFYPIPSEISSNSKFYPFFKNAIGAIDGTHLNCHPSKKEHDACHNRKGSLTQNCLACCTFDLRFQYILSGWEGSASDSFLFNQARTLLFLLKSIFLLMQALAYATALLYHIVEFDITYESGDVLVKGMLWC